MSTSTPWGKSDYSERFMRGITFYGTPGHGGFKVCPTLNEKIPAYMRCADGWYEEDCDWAIVATVFPEAYLEHEGLEKGAKSLSHARQCLRSWHPDAYEAFYGVTLKPGESYIRDERVKERLAPSEPQGAAS